MKRFATILTLCALPSTAALAQSAITLGTAGSVVGSMGVNNATSGTITVTPPTGALGTPTLTWPATTGTLAINGTGAVITTSQSPTAADFNANCKIFTVNAASLNINIPAASTLQSNGGCFFVNNPSANSYTLTPNGSDNLNGSNSAKTYAAQTMTLVTSDGSTNDYAAVLGTGSSGVTSLAGTANQITASASTGAVTLSIPSAFTFPGTVLVSQNGAASAPAMKFTGTITTGSATTAQPLVLIQPSTATGCTAWDTSGTALGVCAHTGLGMLLDLQVDGTSQFSVAPNGTVLAGFLDASNIQSSAGGFLGFDGRAIFQSPSDGVMDLNTNNGATPGSLELGTIVIKGATPTLTGTCTTGTKVGGQTGGTFVATCSSQTVIITFATTAPHGWNCYAQDRTTPADSLKQTASSTTSCTLTGTTAASDVMGWNGFAY